MHVTHQIVKFPTESRVLQILLDKEKDHKIRLVIRREIDGKELPVVVQINGMIGVFSTKLARWQVKEGENARKLSVNFVGECSEPGVLGSTDKTEVEIEYWFFKKQGTLGAKPLSEAA